MVGCNVRRRRVVAALIVLGTAWSAVWSEVDPARAAPPRTYRRPTTQQRTTTQQRPAAKTPAANSTSSKPTKPATPPPAPTDGPAPPQPRREVAPTAKRSIPHPGSTPAASAPTTEPAPLPLAKPAPIAKPEPAAKPVPVEPAPAPAVVNGAPPAAMPSPAAVQGRTSTLFDPPPIEVKPDADGRYLLRYNFAKGEIVRWRVTHSAKFDTTVQGSSQTAETKTTSLKAWKVVQTQPGGEATFLHTVEAIDMRQKLTGRQETAYDSTKDKDVPPIFAEAAKAVGVPLAEVTIDTRGNVLKRVDRLKRPEGTPTNTITLVLPDKPLAIGESWTSPFDLSGTDGEGKPRTLKARHKLTLTSVSDHTAVLTNVTQILSPIDDPALEAQVMQAEQSGEIVFDLRRGRIVSQTSSLDKKVFGFQGDESKLHYTAQFQESLTDEATLHAAEPPPAAEDKTARRPGPTVK